MRILVLHSQYLSGSVSGENRVVEDEALLLSEAGHEVAVWTPSVGGTSGMDLLRAGIQTIWSRPAITEISRRVKAFRPDVIHFHNLFPALSPASIRAASRTNVPVVVTLHNYRMLCLPATFLRDGRVCEECLGRFPLPGVIHRCYRGSAAASVSIATSQGLHRTLGTYDAVNLYVAVSRFVRDKHLEAGLPHARIIVKPNFAWPSSRRKEAGEYFLYIGRLSPEKGVDTLISAWKQLPHELRIVGDGPDAGRLRAVAPPTVRFYGALNPPRVQEMIVGARAVLVPSLSYEGASRSILEAYAAGVPVLASHMGALPEVVESGRSGLLLPPNSPAAWGAAVDHLMDDELARTFGNRARQLWDERYRPEIALERLELAYRQAAGA